MIIKRIKDSALDFDSEIIEDEENGNDFYVRDYKTLVLHGFADALDNLDYVVLQDKFSILPEMVSKEIYNNPDRWDFLHFSNLKDKIFDKGLTAIDLEEVLKEEIGTFFYKNESPYVGNVTPDEFFNMKLTEKEEENIFKNYWRFLDGETINKVLRSIKYNF